MNCECVVCYELYDMNAFMIMCRHALCSVCYKKLNKHVCPYCRQELVVIKNIKPKRINYAKLKKINPNNKNNKKLNTFLKYRHMLSDVPNKFKEQKFKLLRILLVS